VRRLAALVFCAFGACTAAQAAPAEVADLINRMRSSAGKCGGQPDLRNFIRRAELDRAAAMMADGASMEASARSAGYQSVMVKGILISGSIDLRALEDLLANGYCPFIVDPGLVEIGVHQRGTATTVLLAAAFVPAAGMEDSAIAKRMLQLVNEARAQARQCGSAFYPAAGPVRWNEVLARAAKAHSEDMARNNYFAHNSLNGTPPADRVERAGYDYRSTGENIAAGQMSLEAALASWIASPGHCANLMTADFTEMGVAMAANRQSNLGVYWTQVFGTPNAPRPSGR
jgi:uncharacterized protein YkwD